MRGARHGASARERWRLSTQACASAAMRSKGAAVARQDVCAHCARAAQDAATQRTGSQRAPAVAAVTPLPLQAQAAMQTGARSSK